MKNTDIHWGRFPEYDAFIAESEKEGHSRRETAALFTETFHVPVTDEMVRSRMRSYEYKHRGESTASAGDTAESEETPESKFSASVVLERKRAADLALAREMAQAVKLNARWDEFLDIVRGEFATLERPLPPRIVLPAADAKSTPEKFVQLIGDIHIGELVDPLVVGASFGYNVPIFQERMARLQSRIVRLFTLHSNTAPFEMLRIYFLGDGINNVDMRRGQAKAVDVPLAVRQTLILVYAFEDLLRDLSARLGVPIEVVWEFGNHGRVGEWGANLPADNWDYIAGQMLTVALRDMIADGRVKIHADELKYSITQLGPYRTFSSHGDAVKGGDGFAGLPINGLARALAKDTGLHQQLFDLYFTAHFHTVQDITTQTGRIIMNGAWTGGDNYSVNEVKAASEPLQLAFGIHPERGMTWKTEIQLSPSRRSPSPVTTF